MWVLIVNKNKQSCSFFPMQFKSAAERCKRLALQVLFKFRTEANIHVMQHDCVRQPDWCSVWHTAGFTGCWWLQPPDRMEHVSRDDNSKWSFTQRDNRAEVKPWFFSLSFYLVPSFLFLFYSVFCHIHSTTKWACQCGCLPSIRPAEARNTHCCCQSDTN